MAEYVSKLKPNSWLDPLEVIEHLDIKESKIDVRTNKAEILVQAITYRALSGGVEGNSITITYTGGGTAGAEVVSVSGNNISIQIEDNVSTAAQIKAAFDAFKTANQGTIADSVEAILGTSAPQTIQPQVSLAGGTDPDKDNAKTLSRLEKLDILKS